jgi:heat shock protein 1/8
MKFIPCVVAFRGENEVIIGNAALQQQLKNAPNTFVDIRAMLLDDTASGDRLVHVPALGKDISTAEIVSHFFRNILNQIKQQSVSKLKPIKDCVISLPFAIGDAAKTRFIECAKLGGVRVREFCLDDTSILMSYGLDLPAADKQESKKQVVLVADIGWSQSSIGLYEVNDGLFFLICRRTGTEFNVRLAVEKLVDFCVKDFERKNKMRCSDNKRSIMRLTLECENGVRILSNCQEAMIVVDSLFEGVDYSGKISRSRFDDLCGSGISMLRSIVNSTVEAGHIEASDIKQILFAGFRFLFITIILILKPTPSITSLIHFYFKFTEGGGGGMPIVQTAMKSLFPAAQFPRMQSNISEAACIGAALQGRCYHSSV